MLARSVRPYTSPFRNQNAVCHLVRRHFWDEAIRKAEAKRVKHINAEIEKIIGHPSLSAEYKKRNLNRLCATLDCIDRSAEWRAVTGKIKQAVLSMRLEFDKPQKSQRRLMSVLNEWRAVSGKRAAAHWDAFTLTVFAPRGEVPPAMRVLEGAFFTIEMALYSVQRVLLCIPEWLLANMSPPKGTRLVRNLEVVIANRCADKED